MLSQYRKNLLKKNKDRIKAVKMINGEEIPESAQPCLYDYGDGDTICAASACLTDEERDVVSVSHNDQTINSVVKTYHAIMIDEDDLTLMDMLQARHDDYVQKREDQNSEAIVKSYEEKFLETLNTLLT